MVKSSCFHFSNSIEPELDIEILDIPINGNPKITIDHPIDDHLDDLADYYVEDSLNDSVDELLDDSVDAPFNNSGDHHVDLALTLTHGQATTSAVMSLLKLPLVW